MADEVESLYNEVEKNKRSTSEITIKQQQLRKNLDEHRFNKPSKQLILWQDLAYADGCISSLRFSYDDKLEGKPNADKDIAYFKAEFEKSLQQFKNNCNSIINDRPSPKDLEEDQ